MILRKINAAVGLLSTVFLLIHAVIVAIWTLSRGRIAISAGFMPWILLGLVLIHALISIDLAISAHEDSENRKCKSYPKLNVPTMIQRISGIVLIVFTVLHVAGAAGFMQPPHLVHAILPPLFFGIALTHVAVSTSKAFITLGIGNARFVKTVDIVMKVICGVTLIADIAGFYLYIL